MRLFLYKGCQCFKPSNRFCQIGLFSVHFPDLRIVNAFISKSETAPAFFVKAVASGLLVGHYTSSNILASFLFQVLLVLGLIFFKNPGGFSMADLAVIAHYFTELLIISSWFASSIIAYFAFSKVTLEEFRNVLGVVALITFFLGAYEVTDFYGNPVPALSDLSDPSFYVEHALLLSASLLTVWISSLMYNFSKENYFIAGAKKPSGEKLE